MADENTESFRLDLDSTKFVEGAQKAFESISRIGESSEGIASLVGTLGEVGLAIGVVVAGFLAAKAAMNEAFAAENILAIQKQFEVLSAQAGAYGSKLKAGLVEAGKGWATETELMEAANRAMVNLSIDVNQLPKVLNVARQAAAVMGGTMVEKFEMISRAIEMGSTRALRHAGIIINQKKAYDDYAKSIGTTAEHLNEAGKQQAILNAVLEFGKKNLDASSQGVRTNITLWQQFKTNLKEVGEAIAIIFNKLLGPTLGKVLGLLGRVSHEFKEWLVDITGVRKELDKLTETEKTQTSAIQANEKARKNQEMATKKSLEEELKATNNVYRQMTLSAQINAKKQSDAFKAAGQLGGTAMTGFQNHSVEAFKAIGDGSKTASEAVKDAFLQTLGDMAMQQGIFMMLDAFKTFPFVNIPEFAAGGALVALGGALGGMASAPSTPSNMGGSSIDGAPTANPGNGAGPSNLPPDSSAQQSQKSVNLIIQGHMFTDDRTARWIVDQVRAASDATDFTIKSTSGGFS